MKLNELSPSEVFSYFEKICSIPHGSGNTGMIADYCLEFAKLHGLKARKDAADNGLVIVGIPGTHQTYGNIRTDHVLASQSYHCIGV